MDGATYRYRGEINIPLVETAEMNYARPQDVNSIIKLDGKVWVEMKPTGKVSHFHIRQARIAQKFIECNSTLFELRK